MKYITTLFVFLGIWVLASFINGVLSGTCLTLYDGDKFGNETFNLSMIFSFIFSIPFAGIVWLVTAAAQFSGKTGFALFKTVVIAAFICALIGAILFIAVFGRQFKEASYAVGGCIIFSAITAVTIFRNQLKGNDEAV
jgi:hypothetical protein